MVRFPGYATAAWPILVPDVLKQYKAISIENESYKPYRWFLLQKHGVRNYETIIKEEFNLISIKRGQYDCSEYYFESDCFNKYLNGGRGIFILSRGDQKNDDLVNQLFSTFKEIHQGNRSACFRIIQVTS